MGACTTPTMAAPLGGRLEQRASPLYVLRLTLGDSHIARAGDKSSGGDLEQMEGVRVPASFRYVTRGN